MVLVIRFPPFEFWYSEVSSLSEFRAMNVPHEPPHPALRATLSPKGARAPMQSVPPLAALRVSPRPLGGEGPGGEGVGSRNSAIPQRLRTDQLGSVLGFANVPLVGLGTVAYRHSGKSFGFCQSHHVNLAATFRTPGSGDPAPPDDHHPMGIDSDSDPSWSWVVVRFGIHERRPRPSGTPPESGGECCSAIQCCLATQRSPLLN
jgi:hypothetical protein